MINTIREIKETCPECECDVEKTIQWLYDRGDLNLVKEYYREIWCFYKKALKMQKGTKIKKKARELTLMHFRISFETFRKIRGWENTQTRV